MKLKSILQHVLRDATVGVVAMGVSVFATSGIAQDTPTRPRPHPAPVSCSAPEQTFAAVSASGLYQVTITNTTARCPESNGYCRVQYGDHGEWIDATLMTSNGQSWQFRVNSQGGAPGTSGRIRLAAGEHLSVLHMRNRPSVARATVRRDLMCGGESSVNELFVDADGGFRVAFRFERIGE